ncbi:hypothetical protein Bca4012_009174 [Brassica carinata]|uniref:Uncharacterized protein n=1 Tax=Brassica carinata TaxID=52824 RepID=A0A8X7S1D8_BRACI|nr:hypothetical protein Bca52824_034454 [Brassica carinata]
MGLMTEELKRKLRSLNEIEGSSSNLDGDLCGGCSVLSRKLRMYKLALVSLKSVSFLPLRNSPPSVTVVEMLMDSVSNQLDIDSTQMVKAAELFPSVVAASKTLEVVSSRLRGNHRDALHLTST